MKTFEEAYREEVKRRFSDPEDTNFEPAYLVNDIGWFKEGARWAETRPELINEILTKYMDWVENTSGKKFADWLHEEGGHEKAKTRVRKEFIEFLNQK